MSADVRIEWETEPEEDVGRREDVGMRAEVQRAVEAALEACGVKERVCVFVEMVEPERMREINAQQRGIDRVTDVLSFPATRYKEAGRIERKRAEIDPESGRIALGDLLICPRRAEEQALEYGHSAAREVAYLAAHGILHLLGYDHERETDKRVMRELEERAMEICGVSRA